MEKTFCKRYKIMFILVLLITICCMSSRCLAATSFIDSIKNILNPMHRVVSYLTIKATSFNISTTDANMKIGEDLYIKVAVGPTNVTNKDVKIESSNENVAIVSSKTITLNKNGKANVRIRAVGEGRTIITFKKDSKTKKCSITVKKGSYVYNFNGMNYVLPVKASQFNTIVNYINNNKYYQANNSSWNDKCLGFAMMYAKAINTNNTSIIKNNINKGNNPSGISAKEHSSTDKNVVLKYIANELKNGKTCVIQVNGAKKNYGYSRHYVVVIGYRCTADLNNLSANDLLYLDDYDGKIKRNSSDGRFMYSNTDVEMYKYGYQMYSVE